MNSLSETLSISDLATAVRQMRCCSSINSRSRARRLLLDIRGPATASEQLRTGNIERPTHHVEGPHTVSMRPFGGSAYVTICAARRAPSAKRFAEHLRALDFHGVARGAAHVDHTLRAETAGGTPFTQFKTRTFPTPLFSSLSPMKPGGIAVPMYRHTYPAGAVRAANVRCRVRSTSVSVSFVARLLAVHPCRPPMQASETPRLVIGASTCWSSSPRNIRPGLPGAGNVGRRSADRTRSVNATVSWGVASSRCRPSPTNLAIGEHRRQDR
jgi:hypothetical protein